MAIIVGVTMITMFFLAIILMLDLAIAQALYVILKPGYIPKGLGIWLIVAFLSYITLLYGKSIAPEQLLPILVVPAAIAKILLGIWLLWKRAKIPVIKF